MGSCQTLLAHPRALAVYGLVAHMGTSFLAHYLSAGQSLDISPALRDGRVPPFLNPCLGHVSYSSSTTDWLAPRKSTFVSYAWTPKS